MIEAKSSRYYTYIKPVIENKTVKSVAPYIFSLVTMSVLIIFAIRPTISTIVNLQQEIENNQQILTQLEEKAKNLSEGRQNLDNLSPDIRNKISAATPEQTNVPTVIKNLQQSSINYASVSALQIQPLTIINNNVAPHSLLSLGEIDFSYNTQGTFTQLLGTLQNLSRSPRLFKINNMVLSKPNDGSTVLSISGKAFYLK